MNKGRHPRSCQPGNLRERVAPGFALIGLTVDLPDALTEELTKRTPGGFGTSQEIANAVAFLASAGAGYVAGEMYAVDGSLVMV